jgi:hypothetical protein
MEGADGWDTAQGEPRRFYSMHCHSLYPFDDIFFLLFILR